MTSAPRTIGRCELFGQIARGGMASVHLARIQGAGQFSKTVAIKRMDERIAQDRDFVRMFLDEASLVARVRHPNVVSTLDLIQEGDELLIVMEYVEGVTLKHLTRAADEAGMRIPIEIAVTLIAGALRGLHAAHEATGEDGQSLGVVHRDVSPDNIIVGSDGFPRIIDFGVAKALDRLSTTDEGELKGKIAYMAPEQVGGQPITRRADVFMASIVLWELVTGKRLFKGKSAPEVVYRLVSDDTPLATELDANVPDGVARVVARGLARSPEDRWPTALAMADALELACARVSPTAISLWVNTLAADRLAEVRGLVREMERAPRIAETNETTATAMTAGARQPRSSRNLLIAAGLLAIVAAGGITLLVTTEQAGPASPATTSEPADVLIASVDAPNPAPPTPPVTSGGTLVPPAPSSATPSAVASTLPPATRPRPAPPPKPSAKPSLYGIE